MSIKNYKELIVWQKSIKFVGDIYNITSNFPATEKYRLVDQLCRAAISIPSNIAEGGARKTTNEFIRFIRISLGSAAECETQLIISFNLGYIEKEQLSVISEKLKEISVMLQFLHDSLNKKEIHSVTQPLKLLSSKK